MQQSVLALAILGTLSASAVAASVDVKVTGTVLPSGCTPTLSGGGVIDYGSIRADSLSATDYTVLPVKSLDLTIKCDAPAKVAVKPINGRADTAAGVTSSGFDGTGRAPIRLFGNPSIAVAGLGMDGTKRIGGYALRFSEADNRADNQVVDRIHSADQGSSWTTTGSTAGSGSLYSDYELYYQSWAATGTIAPVAFETLSTKLEIQAYLNKSSELDLSKAVNLDGLTTLELVYL